MTRSDLADIQVIYQTSTERAVCVRETEDRISVDTLRQLLRLDPATGRLYWRKREVGFFIDTMNRTAEHSCANWNAKHAGNEALTADSHGYRHGQILGMRYSAHVVVFALANGHWPVEIVDHRDGDKSNNRPDNLREATAAQNMRNRGGNRKSTSKYCGVSWDAVNRKWRAQFKDIDGVQRHIGRFADESAAARAYDAFAAREHGEFAKLNFPNFEVEIYREDKATPMRGDVVTLTGPEWLMQEKGLL